MLLSDTQIRAALRTYRKDTVWYRRDIKGERAVAEGIIFGRFAGTPVPYLYDDSEQIVEGSDGRTRFKKRPRMFDVLLSMGRLKINRKCTRLITAIRFLKWDEKKPDRPEDKNIGNCNDWWDSCCYTMLDFKKQIALDRQGGKRWRSG